MRKSLLSILLVTVSAMAIPMQLYAVPAIEIVENEFQTISISVSDESTLRVTGAAGQMLYIYNITGVRVMSVRIDGSDKSFDLNFSKGCYIVKVGKVVRKISIR
jgi:hypothetical protein